MVLQTFRILALATRMITAIGIAMYELLLKFQALPADSPRLLLEFLDFLWQKEKPQTIEPVGDPYAVWDTISTWSAEDVKPIEEAGEQLNHWQPESW
jgi:hypothetical protein